MKGIFFYNRQDGSFTLYEHDLDDYLAKTLAEEFRNQGKEAYAVDQAGMHGGPSGSCERCKKSGAELFQDQAPDLAEGAAVGAGGSGAARMVSSRIESPLDRQQGLRSVWGSLSRYAPYLAAVVLGIIGFLCVTGPLAPYLASLPGSLSSLAQATPSSAPTGVVAALPTATTEVVLPTSTPTPPPTSTTIPTSTEVPPTPTPEATCTPAASVTLEDAGKTMCVFGDVSTSYTKDGVFYIIFSNEPGALYLVSYDREWNQAAKGACVQAVGEITKIGNTPIMTFGWNSEVSLCP